MNVPSFIPLMRAQAAPMRFNISDDCTSAADAMQRVRRTRAAFRSPPRPEPMPQAIEVEAPEVISTAPQPRVRDWLMLEHNTMPRPSADSYAWKRVLDEVAIRHGLTVSDIISNRRSHHVVAARHEAFWRMQNDLGLSYMEIGRRCGGREHSAVRHGVLRHEASFHAPKSIIHRGRRAEMSAEERNDIEHMVRAGRSNYAIRQILKIGIIKVRRVRAELEAAGQ